MKIFKSSTEKDIPKIRSAAKIKIFYAASNKPVKIRSIIMVYCILNKNVWR